MGLYERRRLGLLETPSPGSGLLANRERGKPTDNSFVEAFNGKVRAECIDQNWFLSLDDVRVKCEAFRHDYNHVRPHSSIGYKTPAEFMKSIGNPNQPVVP
jgi:putative transposase